MTKQTEAMKLALGKIKSARDCHFAAIDTLLFEAEEILEKALAEQPAPQPEQEPIQQASCLVRRLEGVADLRRLEGDCDEAAVIDEAVAVLKAAPQPAQQESVTWGVDWGKAGDASCVSIIKRLPGGGIEVVAVEYAPYEYNPPAQQEPVAWPIETNNQVETLAKRCGWDNRRYMTPADYQIWCDRMRQFAQLASPQPAQRTWVGLTQEERLHFLNEILDYGTGFVLTQEERLHFLNEILDYGTGFVAPIDAVICNIEAKLKEKNT